MRTRHGGPALLVLGMLFLAGCATSAEKIEDAVDRIGWLEKDSPQWREAVNFLVEKDRTAARIIQLYIPDAYYKGEYYREYKEEIYAIRTGIARVMGRLKYTAAAVALDDFLPTTGGPESMREECAWALGEIGVTDAAVLTALSKSLADTLETSWRVRMAVSIALCKLDDEAGGDRLVRYLLGDDPTLAQRAADGLHEAGYHAVPPLMRALQTDTLGIAPRVAPVLERLCDRLIGELNDEEETVRERAVQALGDIGDRRAEGPLLSVLDKDGDGRVRTAAATALSRMGDKRGMDHLFEALASSDNAVRTEALAALAESGEAVNDRLIGSLHHSDNVVVRAGSAKVLGENRVRDAVEPLVAALGDEAPAVRWSAAIALARIGDKAAEPPLRQLAERERNPDVLHWARWALAQLAGPSG